MKKTTGDGRLMDVATIARELGVSPPGAAVYVLDCDHGTKIGITRQTIEQRIDDFRRGSGFAPTVVRTWPMPNWGRALTIERAAHYLLRDTRTHGEWFHCHPLEACDTIDRLVTHGIPLEATFGEEAAAGIRAYIAERRKIEA